MRNARSTPYALAGAVTITLAAGYLVGRTRPLRAARDWARWEAFGFRTTSKPRMAVAVLLLSDEVCRGWWRNDPPRPRWAPAPQVNPAFANGGDRDSDA